jgi:CheY-like chemotaxis protein
MLAESRPEILVVDDDDGIRETLEDVLSAEGYRVATAGNAAIAVDRIRRGPMPSLMLLDLMMPVLSGWEFLVMAEKDEVLGSVPVVVLSAMTAPMGSPGAQGGVKACVRKPVQLDELLAVVLRFALPCVVPQGVQ